MKKSLISLATVSVFALCGTTFAQETTTETQTPASQVNPVPQNSQTGTMQDSTTQDSSTTNNNQTNGMSQNQMTVSATDARFLKTAAESGLAEIELSRVALKQATSADLRRYAQMMVSHHSEVNSQLKRIAYNKGVTLPTTLNAEHQGAMQRLMERRGTQFNRSYTFLMHDAHKKDVALFQQAIQQGDDPQIKTFAQNSLPLLRDHYQMIAQYRRTNRMPSMVASSRTLRQSGMQNGNGMMGKGNRMNRRNQQNGNRMQNNSGSDRQQTTP